MAKVRICFVLLWSYPLFVPDRTTTIGGSEVRGYLFGKGLSGLSNYDVSFVVFDHGQPKTEQYGKIAVYAHDYYKCGREKLFLRLARKFLSVAYERRRPTASAGSYRVHGAKLRVYSKIDADIYAAFGVTSLSAELAAFCREHRKTFLLFTSNDEDVSTRYCDGSQECSLTGVEGRLGYFALTRADIIITQTEEHARCLRSRFKKNVVVIRNPVELADDNEGDEGASPEPAVCGPYALWVGKSDWIKNPQVLLKLARHVPELQFVMILNLSDESVDREVRRNLPDNVHVVDYVPFREIDSYFAGALALVNTSQFEGCPNTFLQAGKHGVPVLSMRADPDGFLERYGCGIVAHEDPDALAAGLRRLMSDGELRRQYSENIRQYVRQNHEARARVAELDRVIQNLMVERGA